MRSVNYYSQYLILICSLLTFSPTIFGKTLIVCADDQSKGCSFTGNTGIQAAVDTAKNGDEILIRTGVYFPESFRDVSYENSSEQLVIRGYVVIENKTLSISGENGVILNGGKGTPTSAFVVSNANVDLDQLVIRNFAVASADDDLYDGHGIFVINSHVKIKNVLIEHVEKMGLSIRENSSVDAHDFHVLNSHIGIWIREDSKLQLQNAFIGRNDGAGIAAYATSSSNISNSVFTNLEDDGIHADEQANIKINHSMVTYNKPHGLSANGNSQIWIENSLVYGNKEHYNNDDNKKGVIKGKNILGSNPR